MRRRDFVAAGVKDCEGKLTRVVAAYMAANPHVDIPLVPFAGPFVFTLSDEVEMCNGISN